MKKKKDGSFKLVENTFLLSSFLWPIEKPLWVCRYPKIVIDNPRTEAEIKRLTEYVEEWHKLHAPKLKEGTDPNQYVSNDMVFEKMKSLAEEGSYARKFFEENKEKRTAEICAKMWVVFRYEHAGDDIAYQLVKDPEKPIVRMMGEKTEQNEKRCMDIATLAAYLCSRGKEWNSDILFDYLGTYEGNVPSVNPFMAIWMHTMIGSFNKTDENPPIHFSLWKNIEKDMLEKLHEIDGYCSANGEDQLYLIAEMMRIANNSDTKMRFLMQVSLIEMLLTHNPDFNRFNVEDSISKQFRLKVILVKAFAGEVLDFHKEKKRISEIYSLRSALIHGNFKSLNGVKAEVIEEHVEYLNEVFYKILDMWMKNPDFMTFLKDA